MSSAMWWNMSYISQQTMWNTATKLLLKNMSMGDWSLRVTQMIGAARVEDEAIVG
jgi:hypothetical protein